MSSFLTYLSTVLILLRAAALGPVVGAALYAQLEAIWTALGLQDLRMLVLVALLVTAALLRLYAHLGWFD